MFHKIKLAVLYGGRSSEHEISLKSAAAVMKNLDKNKFEIIPIAIDIKGNWWVSDFSQLSINESILIKSNAYERIYFQELVNRCDVVFPVLHGTYGEDGKIQGLLEILNLPYVGANVLGSAIGMDKDVAKRLALADNIPVVPFITFNYSQWKGNSTSYQQKIEKELAYPIFVKPANTGSSLGITKVKKSTDLLAAIKLAFEYDIKILVEKALDVHELEVAVLENLNTDVGPLVSKVGEIIPNHEFYSYAAKYLDEKGAEYIIPAILQKGQAEEIRDLAIKVFVSLACEGMARVDFFVEKTTQKIYLNEINTIPGFTKISMYPKLWEASGLSYQQLLTYLIELAQIRYQRLAKLKYSP